MYNPLSTNKSPVNQYLMNDIIHSTPQQLLIRIYDFAILQCNKNNMVKTNDAIQVLMNSLNYDTEETRNISTGLFRLYKYCQEQMRSGNNDIVHKILTELRESWLSAFNRK
jgi:flagellin-specific chaperone FliS